MKYLDFVKAEWGAAVARGVRQFVVIGGRAIVDLDLVAANTIGGEETGVKVFAVDETDIPDLHATFVPAHFDTETLKATLGKTDFDQLTASLFVWIGDVGYRTMEAVVNSLAFIGSLPRGSGVVLDYAVEGTSIRSLTRTALDALASRIGFPDGIRFLIQPPAVSALLRGAGFAHIADFGEDGIAPHGTRLISAVV